MGFRSYLAAAGVGVAFAVVVWIVLMVLWAVAFTAGWVRQPSLLAWPLWAALAVWLVVAVIVTALEWLPLEID